MAPSASTLSANNAPTASAPPATSHDYENLALININRCLATATEGETVVAAGVTHWRTYSDMANSRLGWQKQGSP